MPGRRLARRALAPARLGHAYPTSLRSPRCALVAAPARGAKPLYGVVPQDGAAARAAEDLDLMPDGGIGASA